MLRRRIGSAHSLQYGRFFGLCLSAVLFIAPAGAEPPGADDCVTGIKKEVSPVQNGCEIPFLESGAKKLPSSHKKKKQKSDSRVRYSNPRTYRVEESVTVINGDYPLRAVTVVMPYPEEIPGYQKLVRVSKGDGKLLKDRRTGASYLQFHREGFPEAGESTTFTLSYEVTLHEIATGFPESQSSISPMRMDHGLQRYSRAAMPYIDPYNREIQSIGDQLWLRSHGDPLLYARFSYEYVASHFKYQNANTGLHPISQLLASGGGDCGNLTSLVISLLRYKKIAARHNIAVQPDGNYHAWGEFFVSGMGWIPFDTSYKNGNPSGDYFGKIRADSYGIVFNHDVNIHVDGAYAGAEFTVPLLQSFAWWVWGDSSDIQGHIRAEHHISITPVFD